MGDYATSGHRQRGSVRAVLGPTNTGKTHRAIERMLELDSGMMGLPLRLLAREVYDRVSGRLGEQAVALVTGEEKRVPPHPRYWVCTVEAMPPDVEVDFLAVDEIQLMEHPERGHVFTDRLLRWRGRQETWFLGSDRAEGLIRALLHGVEVQRLPRLSRLSYTGAASMRTLPRRSAVVAFSMASVYELADALRYRRGGAAVVLGALSPRVRNAQVALFQAGEVDFLVATDAIGMGLNLDLGHVALASSRKFDGREQRALEPAELSQIFGRAGRYSRDGTFGTLLPEPELAPHIVEQLERHRFAALRQAYYRNAELDFDDPAALLRSLEARPRERGLTLAPAADDLLVLRVLAARPEIAALTSSAEHVRALWDVCRIPNYEKRLPEHQAERVWPLFAQLVQHGRLDTAFVDDNVRRLERFEGDLDTLLERLSAVRTWTYVSHQRGWVADARGLQERTHALEDRLGDLLHERLIERFVEARARAGGRSFTPARGAKPSESHPFAKLAQLYGSSAESPDPERERRAYSERLIAAPFAALEVNGAGELRFEGQRVARLSAGPTLLTPGLKLLLDGELDGGARVRVERRLLAHVRDLVAHLLEPIAALPRDSAPLRGLSYQLEQGLGTVARASVDEQLRALTDGERVALSEGGLVFGGLSVYSAPMLDEPRRVLRAALCRASFADALFTRALDELWFELPRTLEVSAVLALGFVPLARWAVRCHVLETLRAQKSAEDVALTLGCSAEIATRIFARLPRQKKKRRRRTRRPVGTASE